MSWNDERLCFTGEHLIDPLQECECMANRRRANLIRRELNAIVEELRSFDSRMRIEKERLESLHLDKLSELEKVT